MSEILHAQNESNIIKACREAQVIVDQIQAGEPFCPSGLDQTHTPLSMMSRYLFALAYTESVMWWGTSVEIRGIQGDGGDSLSPWQIQESYEDDARIRWALNGEIGPRPNRNGSLLEQALCVVWYVHRWLGKHTSDAVALHHFGWKGYTNQDSGVWAQYLSRYYAGIHRWAQVNGGEPHES